MPTPLAAGCVIQVSIPSDFKGIYHLIDTVQVEGIFGFIRNAPFSILPNNVLEITDSCVSYIDNQLGNATIKIQYVQNPNVVADT